MSGSSGTRRLELWQLLGMHGPIEQMINSQIAKYHSQQCYNTRCLRQCMDSAQTIVW